MATGDLCTRAEVKTALGLGDDFTREDQRIDLGIELVSAAMRSEVGRAQLFNEASDQVTEYHDGEGECDLWLHEWPVSSIVSVHDSQDRSYGALDELIENADFVVESDQYGARLRRLPTGVGSILTGTEAGVFAKGVRNVRVIYVPGYTTRAEIPRELIGVAVAEVIAWTDRTPHAGQDRLQAGDESHEFTSWAWRPESRRILGRYKRLI